jgi:ABC-type transport system substrate-binding protein
MGVAAGSVYDPMATVIQDELGKIGITVDVQRVPQAQTNVMFNSGALDAQVQTLAAQPDPSGMLSAYYLGGANLIGKGPDRADIQVLADKGLDPRTTPAERNVDYQKVFAAIAKGYYSVPICINAHLWLHNSKVIDPLKTTPWLWAGLPDFRNISMTK